MKHLIFLLLFFWTNLFSGDNYCLSIEGKIHAHCYTFHNIPITSNFYNFDLARSNIYLEKSPNTWIQVREVIKTNWWWNQETRRSYEYAINNRKKSHIYSRPFSLGILSDSIKVFDVYDQYENWQPLHNLSFLFN